MTSQQTRPQFILIDNLVIRRRSRNLTKMSSERPRPSGPPWTRQSSRWYRGAWRPSPRPGGWGGGWRPSCPSGWAGRRRSRPGPPLEGRRAPGTEEATPGRQPSLRSCSPPGNCRELPWGKLLRPEMLNKTKTLPVPAVCQSHTNYLIIPAVFQKIRKKHNPTWTIYLGKNLFYHEIEIGIGSPPCLTWQFDSTNTAFFTSILCLATFPL